MLLLLTMGASDTSVPASARVQNYTRLTCFISPLWKDPDGSAWWSITCPEGSLLLCGTRQLYFCHPSFSATDSNCKDCTIHARSKNIDQPLWLVWLLAFRPITPVENAEAQGGVNFLSSELQAQAKNMWERHNNPNPQHCQRSFPICNSGKTQ